MTASYHNILVTRTDRIGDVILSLPVAAAIKDVWPSARVTFYVREYAAPVVEMCPWVDDILLAPDAGAPHDIAHLKQQSFDAAVCLFPKSDVAAALRDARIPVRVGTARRLFSYRFNKRVNISRAAGGRHERDFNVDLLAGLGIEEPNVVDPVCVPTDAAMARGREFLHEKGMTGRFVIVHPGCGGSARNWTPSRYRELCQWLLVHGHHVLLTGSESELSVNAELSRGLPGTVANAAGETDLLALAGIMAQASAFVGPSTGPMHLAAAVGLPVVALFGPVRTTEADRWGPLGPQHAIYTPGVPTCDCPLNACKLGDCMDRIAVSLIGERVAEIAGQRVSH